MALEHQLSDALPHLHRSTDAGVSFSDLGALPATPRSDLIAHPATADLLYYLNTSGRLEWSSDGGATWNVTAGTVGQADRLAVDANDPDFLIAWASYEDTYYTAHGATFYTSDRGGTWIQTAADVDDIYSYFGIEG